MAALCATASSSAFKAPEDAFALIGDAVGSAGDGTQPEAKSDFRADRTARGSICPEMRARGSLLQQAYSVRLIPAERNML
ncbi:MAG: hypothetical protein J0J01_14265 [Reyranella sp.]|uniref:hypothetical protein n=1 Tax=Reyranella sp. TaxID=1929291 RepID=UPI001ACBB071|nr:hypothetical protein [Reyranella sp.]MBN9088070.1 hypothetical protein [Reyranella sp.]